MHVDTYAVVGNPIAHSLSPAIHRHFSEQTQQALVYDAYPLTEENFKPWVKNFFCDGKGLSVTVPFKRLACQVADTLTPRAELAEAVNTLVLREDGVLGDNTDGVGFLRDLAALGIKLHGASVLMIGAGGAMRGLLGPVLEENPGRLVLVNRTAPKAAALVAHFTSSNLVTGGGLSLAAGTFDIVINGTSASLKGQLPDLPNLVIDSGTCVYDLMYGAKVTPFNAWAQKRGAGACHDGLGMLVEQAAEAFFQWRGVMPDSRETLVEIRASLS